MPYPIMMLVYNRKEHTKKTIECLAANQLADKSDLYIFSDMAKTESDLASVQEVRDYIKTVVGFKSVNIIEWKFNKGVFQSTLDASEYMCKLDEAFVGIEDDIETSPYFLKYINEALLYYKDNQDVIVATAYFPQGVFASTLKHIDYKKDVMMIESFHSYGWGSWRDKWRKIDLKINKDFNCKYSVANIFSYAHAGFRTWGEYWSSNVAGPAHSNLWDIRLAMYMHENKKHCLWPCCSYTRNFGFDGSGIHPWIINTKLFNFSIKNAKEHIKFDNDVVLSDSLATRMSLKLGSMWVFSFFCNFLIKLFRLSYHRYDSRKDDEVIENPKDD